MLYKFRKEEDQNRIKDGEWTGHRMSLIDLDSSWQRSSGDQEDL